MKGFRIFVLIDPKEKAKHRKKYGLKKYRFKNIKYRRYKKKSSSTS